MSRSFSSREEGPSRRPYPKTSLLGGSSRGAGRGGAGGGLVAEDSQQPQGDVTSNPSQVNKNIVGTPPFHAPSPGTLDLACGGGEEGPAAARGGARGVIESRGLETEADGFSRPN